MKTKVKKYSKKINNALSSCTCKYPKVEKCLLSDDLFCMNCLKPIKTGK